MNHSVSSFCDTKDSLADISSVSQQKCEGHATGSLITWVDFQSWDTRTFGNAKADTATGGESPKSLPRLGPQVWE